MRTQWRLIYDLPPTDPRYLEADERTILMDLAVRAYASHQRRAAQGDPAAIVADQQGDPAVHQALKNIRKTFGEGSPAQRAATDLQRSRRKPVVGQRVTSITLGSGKIGT